MWVGIALGGPGSAGLPDRRLHQGTHPRRGEDQAPRARRGRAGPDRGPCGEEPGQVAHPAAATAPQDRTSRHHAGQARRTGQADQSRTTRSPTSPRSTASSRRSTPAPAARPLQSRQALSSVIRIARAPRSCRSSISSWWSLAGVPAREPPPNLLLGQRRDRRALCPESTRTPGPAVRWGCRSPSARSYAPPAHQTGVAAGGPVRPRPPAAAGRAADQDAL